MELRRHNCEMFCHQDSKSLLWALHSPYPSLQGINSCVRFLASLFSVKCESKPPPSDKGNTVGLQQMLLWYYLNSGKLLSEIGHVTLDALFCFIKAIFSHRFLMRNACMNVGEERVQSCKLVSDVLCSHQNSPVVC